jgi:hypothetical protein
MIDKLMGETYEPLQAVLGRQMTREHLPGPVRKLSSATVTGPTGIPVNSRPYEVCAFS